MSTKRILSFLAGSITLGAASIASAAAYECTTKARENLMQPFETVTGSFDGVRPYEQRVNGFVTKLQKVRVDGQEHIAMWLGVDDAHSSVTLTVPGEVQIYLNTVVGERFAVATCVLQD